MKEVKVCSDGILSHLFPGLEDVITDGYFKAIRTQDAHGVFGPVIFRFTNLSRCAPDGPLYRKIITYLEVDGVSEDDVVTGPYGIMGFEISSRKRVR